MNRNYQPNMETKIRLNLDLDSSPYLKDHRFQEMVVLPGAVYLENLLQIEAGKPTPQILTEIQFHQLLSLSEQEVHSIKLVGALNEQGDIVIRVIDAGAKAQSVDDPPALYMTGKISAETNRTATDNQKQLDLSHVYSQWQQKISAQDFYDQLQENGNQYGPAFRPIKQIMKNATEACGEIQTWDSRNGNAKANQRRTSILDACAQTLSATHNQQGYPFLWVGVEKIITRDDLIRSCFIYAKRQSVDESLSNIVTGDVYLVDEAGQVIAELLGLQLQYTDGVSQESSAPAKTQKTVVIAASFTAEPIKETLDFWQKKFEMPYEIVFAPYNQVYQQLLDPSSLLNQNKEGANVLLIRPEDWLGTHNRLALKVSLAEKEQLLADHLRYALSDHLEIAHLNQYETDYVFQEIFEDKTYLKHGITLGDSDCVIDVGANIGLFTLFVEQQCQDPTIYAFEPSPPVFEILQTNAELYGSNVKVFNCGLSNQVTEAPFTFYKYSSVFSSYQPDFQADKEAINTVVQNVLQKNANLSAARRQSLADDLTTDRIEAETLSCQLTTLSNIIREHQIEQIDLLKIDVERSELAVLEGIDNEDWGIIRQVVLEVHDQQGDVIKQVMSLLEAKGFDTTLDEESLLQGSGLYNVYAIRRLERPGTVSKDQLEMISAGIEKLQIVEDFVGALKSATKQSQVPYLLCICPASSDIATNSELTSYFSRLETYLETELSGLSGLHFVGSEKLNHLYPVADYYNPYTDQLGHIPYTPVFFTALGTMVARTLYAWHNLPYKVVVLDCDQTLWQGICSEDGPTGITLTPPYQALQAFVVAKHQEGMLLCLCSKNSEDDVFAVFEQRPEMPLKRDHLVSWRINWQPKSENIRFLAQELQLGLDAFIFIDDNPLECEDVRINCPEVLTLQLPQNPEQIPNFLDHLWAFDNLNVTEVDRQRTKLYEQDLQRRQFEENALSLTDFLDRLNLEVEISGITPSQLSRVSQLTLRTNQFNCTTVRRTGAEIRNLIELDGWSCLTVTVRDRFGDYGLVGVMLFEARAKTIQVDTFLLSCRALGRGVEQQMLARLGEIAEAQGLDEVVIPFIPTAKNQPAQNFLESVAAEAKTTANRQTNQKADETLVYHFPTKVAKYTTYQVKTTAKPQADPLIESSPTPLPKAETQANSGADAALLHEIATDLYRAKDILDQIGLQVEQHQPNEMNIYVAPSTELEYIVAEIWQKVLNVDRASVKDKFLEMGGSSLKAIQLIALLELTLSKQGIHIDIAPISLTDDSTIEDIVRLIEPQQVG